MCHNIPTFVEQRSESNLSKQTYEIGRVMPEPCPLTEDNVGSVYRRCQLRPDERPLRYVVAQCFGLAIPFNEERLDENRQQILDMLNLLPEAFRTEDGISFFEAHWRNDGAEWTQKQVDVEWLILLGLAIEEVEYTLPRGLAATPADLPYFRAKQ